MTDDIYYALGPYHSVLKMAAHEGMIVNRGGDDIIQRAYVSMGNVPACLTCADAVLSMYKAVYYEYERDKAKRIMKINTPAIEGSIVILSEDESKELKEQLKAINPDKEPEI